MPPLSSPLATRPPAWPSLVMILSLGLGIVIRLRQWLVGRSLWLDEAALGLNIVGRDAAGLLRPLDHYQGAPIGYLLLSRLAVVVVGPGEQALRLVPLLAGVAALLVFAWLAPRLVGRRAGALAVALLALAPLLISYSNEVKQYGLDVLTTGLGLALFCLLRRPLTPARTVLAAVGGMALLWFSHPAVFVLAAVGLVALAEAWRRDDRRAVWLLAVVGLAWGGTFIGLALLSLGALTGNETLRDFWSGGFLPPPTRPWELLQWFWAKLNDLTSFTLGLSAVALVAAAAGSAALRRRDRGLMAVLLLPIGFALLAAALGRYPFADRLLLFTTPLMALLIGEGTLGLVRLVRPLGRLPAYALVVLMLWPALLQTAQLLREPQYKEELRPVLAHVAASWQDGDRIALYYSSYLAFEYYQARFGFADEDVTVIESSRDSWVPYFRALDEIVARGGRTWIVLSHVYTEGGSNEEALLINYLYQLGYPALDIYLQPGASAYLFDFPAP